MGADRGPAPAVALAAPEGRVLTYPTRELLVLVLAEGTDADRAALHPLEDYTFPLDPARMHREEARYNAALDALHALALAIGSRAGGGG